MLPSESHAPPAAPMAASSSLSPLERAIAIFVRPAAAWEGLTERAQWWIPFLTMLIALLVGSGLTFQRAQLPMILDSMQEKVASGDLPPEQVQKIEEFYTSPAGMALMLGSAGIFVAAIPFVVALLIWFAVGFVLGAPLRFRLALEVSAWSSLVTLPAAALQFILGWIQQDMRSVHVGFGVLLPQAGPDDRMLRAVGMFLDWIGPFGIWHVVVAVLGAAALSGAPRKSVAWALGTLYVVCGLVGAGLTALLRGPA
jgi:Yip1-like protein